MDSMRSLNTSLPSAPPEQLLQAFRTAALSVTNLYKAATDQTASRQAGYQDALEDLLSFLDRENIGLQDGEGWRIRQWATERYNNDRMASESPNENEEPQDNTIPREHASQTPEPAESESKTTVQSSPSAAIDADRIITSPDETTDAKPASPVFQFVGVENVRNADQMTDVDNQAAAPSSDPVHVSTQHTPRHSALLQSRRSTAHASSRASARTSARDVTLTTGTKRKIQVPDFFNFSDAAFGGFNGQGGGKRGRFA